MDRVAVVETGSSASDRSVEWWKFLWNLRIPNKVRIFIWRACQNLIPTSLNLAKRGIPCNDFCLVCSAESESTVRALVELYIFWPYD